LRAEQKLGRLSRPGLALALSNAKHGTAAGDGLLLFDEFLVTVGELFLGGRKEGRS